MERPGDTLSSIAERHQISVTTLRDLNRLRSNRLRIGQVLSIPSRLGSEPTGELLQAVARRTPSTPRSYRVKAGDNLWDIAKAQRVSVRDLQRWNKLSGSSLKVGQALFLQGPAPASATKAAAPTYYKVRKGDSLYQIAKRFNIHVSKLKTWNPKGTQVLRPGQLLTLYLPN